MTQLDLSVFDRKSEDESIEKKEDRRKRGCDQQGEKSWGIEGSFLGF